MKKWLMLLWLLLIPLGTASAEVLAYPVPEGTPTEQAMFRVTADGQEVGVYSDYNMEFYEVSFAYFHFTPDTAVEVKVRPDFPFQEVEVLPKKPERAVTVEDGEITLTLTEPGEKLSFVFDGDYQAYALHLFTSPIDTELEKKKDGFGVRYFGPGYHDLSDQEVALGTGMTLIVAPGAVLNAPVVVYNASNVIIEGGGVIMMDKKSAVNPEYGNIVITLNHAKNVIVRDVIACSHRPQNWTTHVYFSSDVTIDNYKVFSPQYASTDAIDITNSQRVTVTNSFLRSCDDCVTIKGLANASLPKDAPPNEDIHVSATQLWNDCNNAMVIGEESMAAYYDNITFRDIDVLYSYDDRDNHERLDERAVMSIVTLHGTDIRNILWEDIRVNNCQRLVCFNFKDSFWFGTIQGNQTFPGGAENITLRNITCESSGKSAIANEILIHGWAEDKLFRDITFDNVVVDGVKLTSMLNPYFKVNDYIRDIRFQ